MDPVDLLLLHISTIYEKHGLKLDSHLEANLVATLDLMKARIV